MSKSLVLPMENVSVCMFKTSPFVLAPRAHMFQHVCAWCRYTRGRFERTHRDVLSGHTGFFSVSHKTHHSAHTTTQQHDHNTIRRQRQTETERRQRRKEDRDREKKTEEEGSDEKRRQKETRREGRRFTFSVVVHGRFCWCSDVRDQVYITCCCEFFVWSAFLSLVWHMHGVCLLHGHAAHSSHYG